MHADALLAEVEPLTFRQRCRRLAELRELARTRPAGYARLLRELGERGHYERSLGLSIAVVACNAAPDDASRDHVRRVMGDRDAGLAARAISAAARLGLEAAAFQDLSMMARPPCGPRRTRRSARGAAPTWPSR